MQFHEKEIQRILHACEYYRSIIRSQDKNLAEKYDSVIHKVYIIMSRRWTVLIVGIQKEFVMYIPKFNKEIDDEEVIDDKVVISKSFAVETLSDKINFFHKSIGIESANQLLRDIIDRDHKEFSQYDFWCKYTYQRQWIKYVKPIDVIWRNLLV